MFSRKSSEKSTASAQSAGGRQKSHSGKPGGGRKQRGGDGKDELLNLEAQKAIRSYWENYDLTIDARPDLLDRDEYEKISKSKAVIKRAVIQYKCRKLLKQKHREKQARMAVKIAARWRGVMVRSNLQVLKVKADKERKNRESYNNFKQVLIGRGIPCKYLHYNGKQTHKRIGVAIKDNSINLVFKPNSAGPLGKVQGAALRFALDLRELRPNKGKKPGVRTWNRSDIPLELSTRTNIDWPPETDTLCLNFKSIDGKHKKGAQATFIFPTPEDHKALSASDYRDFFKKLNEEINYKDKAFIMNEKDPNFDGIIRRKKNTIFEHPKDRQKRLEEEKDEDDNDDDKGGKDKKKKKLSLKAILGKKKKKKDSITGSAAGGSEKGSVQGSQLGSRQGSQLGSRPASERADSLATGGSAGARRSSRPPSGSAALSRRSAEGTQSRPASAVEADDIEVELQGADGQSAAGMSYGSGFSGRHSESVSSGGGSSMVHSNINDENGGGDDSEYSSGSGSGSGSERSASFSGSASESDSAASISGSESESESGSESESDNASEHSDSSHESLTSSRLAPSEETASAWSSMISGGFKRNNKSETPTKSKSENDNASKHSDSSRESLTSSRLAPSEEIASAWSSMISGGFKRNNKR